jgi:hypothetical protein
VTRIDDLVAMFGRGVWPQGLGANIGGEIQGKGSKESIWKDFGEAG